MASPRDRFFVEGVHALGATVAFAADDARKLATVLRARTGDRVEVIDSAGRAFAASLAVDGGRVRATLDEAVGRGAPESGARVAIAQALPKGRKMDLIVEKATELGAAAIFPLRSERVAGDRTGDAKGERWQRIAKSAAQQCGRTTIPQVAAVSTWDELLPRFGEYERIYVPWELAEVRPLREVLEPDAAVASALFVIGPEGGFAAHEVERAVAAGARAISLGRRILRTETVALAVLSAFAYARGEL